MRTPSRIGLLERASPPRSRSLARLFGGLTLLLAACDVDPTRPQAIAVHLIDAYKPPAGAGAPKAEPIPPTVWRFDGDPPAPAPEKHPATRGWEPSVGIAGLAIRDGRLVGRTTSANSILHLERSLEGAEHDEIHSLELRMKVSGGADLEVGFFGAPNFDQRTAQQLAELFIWPMRSPLRPGEMRTYTLTSQRPIRMSDTRHLMIRPADSPEVDFEIESVRLISRKEYLAGIPSGVSWQGLGEIYRESIVTRSPETLALRVHLPPRAWLDLNVGTVSHGPVTFRVAARRLRPGAPSEPLLEHTLTSPYRWEKAHVDLAQYGHRTVTLELSLAAAEPGALGIWGSPVVRSHRSRIRSVTTARAEAPQGVIVIWADTLRSDHLDVYGYQRPTAPALRQMAREGVLFRHNVSQATWTKVATPSLLTSLYPTTHGIKDFYDRLPASATTLAEIYRQAGAATLSMSSVLFTGRFTNLHQGFEELHEDVSLPDQESSKTARVYVDRLLPWLESHRDVPFFVFLHVTDPHDPFRPYPPYDTMWADPERGEEYERQLGELRKIIRDPLMRLFGMPTRADLSQAGIDAERFIAHVRDWYDGSIRAMDVEIARLVERLRALGLDQRVAVVLAGDHGEEFLEHGRTFHGQTVYGELTGVPLIFWGPGFLPAGRTIEHTVETIDVMPTLLELSGLRAPREIQGRSLMPLLRGDDGWTPRPAFAEKALTDTKSGGPPPHETEAYAIYDDGWKLIHNVARHDGAPEFELYDARRDPLNLTNVADRHPDLVIKLSRRLQHWRNQVAEVRLKPDTEAGADLSPAELERLRSLGYIQ